MHSALLTLLALWPGLPADPEMAAPDAIPKGTAPAEGIWPTQKMIDGLLARWADETALKYELDQEQAARSRRMITARWSAFLKENRRSLQPLLNEYIEARLALAPPESERVRRWAKRALPLFEDFHRQIGETQEELSGLLTPIQQAKLGLETIKISTGLHLFAARLEAWQRGEFEQDDWWQPTRRERRKRRETEEKVDDRENLVASKTKTRIDEELLRWDYFVAEFVEQYKLDDMQREAAYSILRECKQKALAHRDRYRVRLERLEEALVATAEVPDKLRSEGIAMYGPIDELFVELKSRLEQIPTTAQSAQAASKAKPSTDTRPKADRGVDGW